MCKGYCTECKFADWDSESAYGGDISFVCGCKLSLEEIVEKEQQLAEDGIEIDESNSDEWGDTVECPYWEEARYEDDYT